MLLLDLVALEGTRLVGITVGLTFTSPVTDCNTLLESEIMKAEQDFGLHTSDFKLRSWDFSLQTLDFGL